MLEEKPVVYALFVPCKLIIQASIVYFNLNFLIPKFFYPKNTRWLYWILVTLLLAFTGLLNFLQELVAWKHFNQIDPPDLLKMYLLSCQVPFRFLVFSALLKATVDYYKQNEYLKKIELEKATADLNFLKAQVNPHFLFNSLNNLYALILEKSDKSAESVLMLADIMKYLLSEGKEDKVLLQKEIKLLQNYTELERLRKPDAAITFTVSGDTERFFIPPLLLLPLIENAFKYGLNTVSKNGFVRIDIKCSEKDVRLVVENNVPPVNNSAALQSLGIGIENVKKRLELLYNNRYQLTISNAVASFIVHLQLQPE
jgi:two-component system, LytTR family, sensor kinase